MSYKFCTSNVLRRNNAALRAFRDARRSYSDARTCPELRILFCGSDDFSATSLTSLAKAQKDGRLPIRSLDVVCRPPKRVGTGLKRVREVPIVETANSLNLPVHKIDSFKGWDVPRHAEPINLIIAVSFGLLVPARIINSAKYGGLNVHPSMLPDFRGAAPIEHSLLAGCRETGVSLQTLHPSKFDHGDLLMQAPISLVPGSKDDNVSRLAGVGANLLVDGLASAVFVPPLQSIEPPQTYPDGTHVQERKAPKIAPEDRRVDWQMSTADDILRRSTVLGPLWNHLHLQGKDHEKSRIKWTSGFRVTDDASAGQDQQAGDMFYKGKRIRIVTSDRRILCADAVTLAGKPERKAHEAAQLLFAASPVVRLT